MSAHLLFLVGTTATGKSDLAVRIAEETNAEIINSDSVAFFDEVDIGAAKPSQDHLRRVPHHLVGHVKAHQKYTAADFRREALKLLDPHKKYVVVGGSGFYVQALEKGMYDVADPNPEAKAAIAIEDPAKLYAELKEREPDTKIAPADHYRIARAIEILRAKPGQTMAQIKAEFERTMPVNPFTSKKIGLFRPRDILRQKVTERTHQMLANGLIEEVTRLRAKGLGQWAPMQSVGYKEIQAHLDGTLADPIPLIITSTMQLAKQQSTWFKRDPQTEWFESDTALEDALAKGVQLLTQV